jgi:hypothetical protein
MSGVDGRLPGPDDRYEMPSMVVTDEVVVREKGAFLIGELEGSGRLRVGDLAICDGRQLEISWLERFHQILTEVAAGSGAVAVGVGDIDGAAALKGKVLRFEPRPVDGMPALADGGVVVPDQALLVGFSQHRRSAGRRFAVLILEGLRVRLVDGDGRLLVDAPGEQLYAEKVSGTQVALRSPDGEVRYLVGPQPEWAKRRRGAELVGRYGARIVPDPRLEDDESSLAKFMVTPATAKLRYSKRWAPVLLKMLGTRGVRATR